MRRWGGVGLGALVGVVVLALVVGLASVGDAAFPGRDGRIAFAWYANTRVAPQSCGDIFLIHPNGSDRQRLTHGCPWAYSDPAYSPTGKQIVFVRTTTLFVRHHRGQGIYLMSADGSHVRQITASPRDGDPSFSPDGRWIVFDRYVTSSTPQIFRVSVDGGHVRQLTHLHRGAADPVFSPNGREIAFAGDFSNSIEAMRSDGSHVHTLARVRQQFGFYTHPDFSPNGRSILFTCGVAPGLGSTGQVCVMAANGRHLKYLTPGGRNDPLVVQAAFSPDGHRIGFVAFRNNQSAFVYTMAKNGSDLHRIYDLGPHEDGTSLGVSWQPLP